MDHIDDLICAELPDPSDPKQKKLFDIVSSNMVHGPCGQFNPNCVCMVDNKCSKNFPKEFRETTNSNVNGYPLYRRRDNGFHILKKLKVKNHKGIDQLIG